MRAKARTGTETETVMPNPIRADLETAAKDMRRTISEILNADIPADLDQAAGKLRLQAAYFHGWVSAQMLGQADAPRWSEYQEAIEEGT